MENSIISPVSNIIKYESSSLTIFFKELLQELYIYLLNFEIDDIDKLYKIIKNCLLDYDFDPINVLEIMTSCSQNYFYYSSLIGYFYQHGIGCKFDEIKAFKIYSDAINAINNNEKSETITFCNNDIKKLNEIILQYFYSLFFYKDIMSDRKNIYKLHIKNAENGDNVSQYYIGKYYYHCKNIKQNFDKATEWYTKSSGGGNIRAMFMLGVCYYYGLGVIKDENKSFEFYLKSAEGGYKDASYFVGNCYHHGRSILKDERKAFEFYLRAAEKGVGCCQYLVANYYNEGKYIPKNKEKGFYWNRKAAINGISEAQLKLAEDYLNNSINKNEKKAFKWYLKLAADKNRLRAIYLVAKCYRDGIGTDKNLEESTKWFKKYAHNPSITLNDFLNGSDINAFEIPGYVL